MERIVELVAKLEGSPEGGDARALVSEVLAFHEQGLRRIVERVDPEVIKELARDPLVASLLELHDLAPDPTLVPATKLVRKPAHRCDLCGAVAEADHLHLVEITTGAVRCGCRACALLFDEHTAPYRRIPAAVTRAPALAEDDAWWQDLGLPIGVAFVVAREGGGAIARYPGPAGVTEAAIAPEVWSAIAARHRLFADLVPEVQALVVNRTDGARDHWVVGVDRCYELVARVREHWQGLTGGASVRIEIRRFFDALAGKAA